jgi:Cro/C1-type HTH DNA-binding domain
MGLGHSSVDRLLASMRIGAEMDGEPQRTVCRPTRTDRGPHATTVYLDGLLRARGLTLTELADLTKLCQVLACQPADLLTYDPD